ALQIHDELVVGDLAVDVGADWRVTEALDLDVEAGEAVDLHDGRARAGGRACDVDVRAGRAREHAQPVRGAHERDVDLAGLAGGGVDAACCTAGAAGFAAGSAGRVATASVRLDPDDAIAMTATRLTNPATPPTIHQRRSTAPNVRTVPNRGLRGGGGVITSPT